MYKLATIQLSSASPSPTNPRKHFDAAKITELAASVKEKGILQPLVVRPMPGKAGHYEVVCGERRRRAAIEAKLKEIPVSIGDLDDLTVLEIQIIENGQREDVHPLEEADGYRALRDAGRKPEQIAAKLGMSPSHVYHRLRLAELGPVARQAFWDGKIDAAVAQVITRIHNAELRERCATELVDDINTYDGDGVRLEDAKEHVRRNYMLVLASAPFDLSDLTLQKLAGACASCPKRTGAQKDLFGEEGKVDLCLDPGCYNAKADETWTRAAKKAEEGGSKVLSDAEAKKVFPHGSHVSYGSDYVELADHCHDDPKGRTYKALLGARAKEETVLARDSQGGVHQLVKKSAAIAILKTLHKDVAKELERDIKQAQHNNSSHKDEAKKQERRRKVTAAIITEVVQAVTKLETKLPDKAWRALGELVLERTHSDTHSMVAKRRQLESKGSARNAKTLNKHVAELPPAKLPAFIFEMLVTQGAYFTYSDQLNAELVATAKAFGIDPAKVRRTLEIEERAKAKEKAAKAPGKKKARV